VQRGVGWGLVLRYSAEGDTVAVGVDHTFWEVFAWKWSLDVKFSWQGRLQSCRRLLVGVMFLLPSRTFPCR